MRDFNRDDRNGGGNRFGGRDSGGGRGGSRFGGRGGGDRQMHSATCSNCGKDCQVPFRPTGEKPVYCSECFGEKGGNENRRSYDRGDRSSRPQAPNYNDKFDALDRKLDAVLDAVLALQKPKKKTKVEKTEEETTLEE